MASLTDKKFNAVNNFLMKYVDPKAAESFKDARKKGKEIEWLEANWETLDGYEPWTQTYSSIKDLTMPPEDQMQKIYNSNPDFAKISKARLKTILDNGDFTEEQLKTYYQFREDQKKAMDKFNEERYKKVSDEYMQAMRANDDSYFNSPIANEYARKHYIMGHPNQAVVNEIAGKAAAITDFIPGKLAFGGPLIRTVQKWAADEPVFTGGTAADFAGALIPDLVEKPAKLALQSLKGTKVGKWFLESPLGKQLEARIKRADVNEAKLASEELERLKNLDLDKMTNEDLIKYYDSFQTPEIKQEIANHWKARGQLEEARMLEEMPNGITEAIGAKERKEAEQAFIESERKADYLAKKKIPELELKSGQMKSDQPLFFNGDFNPYYKDVPIGTISEHMAVEPNRGADILYDVLTLGGRKAARSTIGGRAGRWDMFDPEPKDNRDQNVEWVIKTYSKGWSPLVKPINYDKDPLLKEAYDKWLEEEQLNNYPVWLKARGL